MSASAWIAAARPKTLTAALTPVVVGSAVAASLGGFRAAPAIAAALGATLIQIGTNLTNDVQDFERGADDEQRLGPVRATQSGLLTPRQVRSGAIVAFLLAGACGLYLALVAGWPVVAIGLASIAAGILYTGGPLPLAYNGLGDLFVFVFFGHVAVCGTVYVQMLRVPEAAWWAAVPVGALATSILVVNNVRDVATDRRAGKRTLQVLLGRRAGVIEYWLLLAVAFAVPAIMASRHRAPYAVLLTWVTLPFAVRWAAVLARTSEGPRLNAALAGTARVLLGFGLAFAAGLVLGGQGTP